VRRALGSGPDASTRIDFIYLTAPSPIHSTNLPSSMCRTVFWAVASMLHNTLHAKEVGQRKLKACRCFTHASVQPLRHRLIYTRLVALYGETLQTLF
jgi:hypothetical protein